MARLHFSTAALAPLVPICALGVCDTSWAKSTEPGTVPAVQNSVSTPLQQATVQGQAFMESDRISLEMADNACKAKDFGSFFDVFITSKDVRLKYSSIKIHYVLLGTGGKIISEHTYEAASYPHFPVMMFDYYYKPVTPARAGDEDEYLDLQFNQSQSNDFSVEWSRVHYDGQSDGGDDLGNPIDASGKPIPRSVNPDPEGQLLFHTTNACWELREDIRFRSGQ